MTKINLRGSKRNIFIILAIVIVLSIILGTTIHAISKTEDNSNEEIIETISELNDEEEQENLENEEDDTEISIEELSNEAIRENTGEKDNKNTYYIKINYGANVVTIYTKDSSGNYTVPVKAMVCSTGTATPRSGTYTIKARYRWLALFGNVYGQYSTQIVGNILFHSVPYLRKGDPSSLEYWEYDKLGTSASMGCIRLTVQDAKWIYDNISSGTMVEFYSDSNPGPLGKPTARKISSNETCRDWDPTDPGSGNPWRNVSNDNVINNTTQPIEQEVPKVEIQEPPKESNNTNSTNNNKGNMIDKNTNSNTNNNTSNNTNKPIDKEKDNTIGNGVSIGNSTANNSVENNTND